MTLTAAVQGCRIGEVRVTFTPGKGSGQGPCLNSTPACTDLVPAWGSVQYLGNTAPAIWAPAVAVDPALPKTLSTDWGPLEKADFRWATR